MRFPLWPSEDATQVGILSVWDSAYIIEINELDILFLTKGEGPCDGAVVRKLFHPYLKLLVITEGLDGC